MFERILIPSAFKYSAVRLSSICLTPRYPGISQLRPISSIGMASEDVAPKIVSDKEGSWAYITARDRWPKIVGKLIDHIHCNRRKFMDEHGEDADTDVKNVIHVLSEMRYRMMTDKPLEELKDTYKDVNIFNGILKEKRRQDEPRFTWFKAEWLLVECYMYRLIYGAFHEQKHLAGYDYFGDQKRDSFKEHLQHIEESAKFTIEASTSEQGIHDVVEALLKSSLWGNQSDLSVSGGDASTVAQSVLSSARARDAYILEDNIEKAIREVIMPLKNKKDSRIDIILDNSGIELAMDLFVAEFLVHAGVASKVVLHGKKYPWFVSDVTYTDFVWTVEQMRIAGGSNERFYERFRDKMDAGTIAYTSHDFWTWYHPFCEISSAAPDLHSELQQSDLLIFKGDLNYRKLVGDRYWPYDYPFEIALSGFLPSNLLALRTLKAETVAGLSQEAVQRMERKFGEKTDWMTSGDYAVAQLVRKK